MNPLNQTTLEQLNGGYIIDIEELDEYLEQCIAAKIAQFGLSSFTQILQYRIWCLAVV